MESNKPIIKFKNDFELFKHLCYTKDYSVITEQKRESIKLTMTPSNICRHCKKEILIEDFDKCIEIQDIISKLSTY
jgi:hypothetical protein